MFSNLTVGLLAGLGAGAWIYSKVYKKTGGNSQNALIVAGSAAFLIFMVIVFALQIFFPS